jgi:hypothetical protein
MLLFGKQFFGGVLPIGLDKLFEKLILAKFAGNYTGEFLHSGNPSRA